ncbi:unnamed protein product [Calypogeia fissa]
MPGTLHVTGTAVLEAVGLPAGNIDSSNCFVSVKVSLGDQEYATCPKRPHLGKTAPWNYNFAFTVYNLTDKLFVEICGAARAGVVSSTAIQVPTIVQEWFREDYVSLDEGGRLHLKLNFTLTKGEGKRLESRRAAAEWKEYRKRRDDMLRYYDFKRKEEQCVNNGLRTIAENARKHAGQPLDNWEVFSRKKGKEVISAETLRYPFSPE